MRRFFVMVILSAVFIQAVMSETNRLDQLRGDTPVVYPDPFSYTTISNHAGRISSLETQRLERLWSSTTNYMDGAGIMYEIITRPYTTLTCIQADADPGLLGLVWAENEPEVWPYYYRCISDPSIDDIVYNWIYDERYVFRWTDEALEFATEVESLSSVNLTFENLSTGGTSIYMRKDFAGTYTNVVDQVVTTNGTIVIIGSTADASGTTTQLVGRAGSDTVNLPFVGRSYVDTALAAIPPAPTNSVTGWLLYDYGSNMWLRVSVSNLSFTVEEVAL